MADLGRISMGDSATQDAAWRHAHDLVRAALDVPTHAGPILDTLDAVCRLILNPVAATAGSDELTHSMTVLAEMLTALAAITAAALLDGQMDADAEDLPYLQAHAALDLIVEVLDDLRHQRA